MKKLLYVLILCLAMIQCAFAAVDINSASEAELDKLPGIGPVKAKAIVEERAKNGKFKSIEDIKRVKGIGDATFDKLKSEISISGAGAAAAATSTKADSMAEKKTEKKAEAKADVKVDSKPETKTETKLEATADKKSKAEMKAEKKAESKAEAKSKSDTKDEAKK